MRMIKWVSDILCGNVREAKMYAHKAHELREENKAVADWCRDMAQKHLEFNVSGHDIVKRMIREYAESGEHSELAPGMMVVYNDRHNDLMAETAEVKAMIEMYK